MNRKPRADSKLKTLPDARQAAIVERARDHTLSDVLQWLRADGLQTSAAALSDFLSWHALRQQLARNASTVETLLANLHKDMPDASPEKIQSVGQAFFSALALEQQDAKGWCMTQQVALKQEQLQLDRQRFQRETIKLFIAWSVDAEAKRIAASPINNDEKTERLGQRLFGTLWK
jgi:hypothetical protein